MIGIILEHLEAIEAQRKSWKPSTRQRIISSHFQDLLQLESYHLRISLEAIRTFKRSAARIVESSSRRELGLLTKIFHDLLIVNSFESDTRAKPPVGDSTGASLGHQ
ncbi:hypothetical protein E3N88_16680 [Mikania micrantha]|uniref:Uncharacterized protein n=1 Tax=Mikania micrantha TaxID=192012 RepID=A0A5N6NYZ8_9ASTR|nr:hypothetical protein E3N88_16680 [Mikania micrantha]